MTCWCFLLTMTGVRHGRLIVKAVPARPGIVDYVSFAVMRRLGIRQAFTNDRHFQEAGFETLF